MTAESSAAFGDASGLRAHGINVLTVSSDRISSIVAFRTPSLFPSFGLPLTLPAG